jgi:hypothetical protein
MTHTEPLRHMEMLFEDERNQEKGDGGASMELTGETGLAGFGVLRQGESGAWRSGRRLSAEKTSTCRIKAPRLDVH